MPLPTVVFDFDGTIAQGDGPVLAYARHAAAVADDPGLFEAALAALADLVNGKSPYRDAYDAVARVSLARGLDAIRLQAAYDASRLELGTAAAPLEAPAGLASFLAELSGFARLALATNAPATGIDTALVSLGAADYLTHRHCSLGKPDGLVPVLTRYLADGPVLSVGDIWEYDLAPADELGATTALVGVTARSTTEHPTMRGATLADLYGEITSWAAHAVPGPEVPVGTDQHNERHD
jgi:phosphoglycolate phosphatase-like HAD superfamily hydrolase